MSNHWKLILARCCLNKTRTILKWKRRHFLMNSLCCSSDFKILLKELNRFLLGIYLSRPRNHPGVFGCITQKHTTRRVMNGSRTFHNDIKNIGWTFHNDIRLNWFVYWPRLGFPRGILAKSFFGWGNLFPQNYLV